MEYRRLRDGNGERNVNGRAARRWGGCALPAEQSGSVTGGSRTGARLVGNEWRPDRTRRYLAEQASPSGGIQQRRYCDRASPCAGAGTESPAGECSSDRKLLGQLSLEQEQLLVRCIGLERRLGNCQLLVELRRRYVERERGESEGEPLLFSEGHLLSHADGERCGRSPDERDAESIREESQQVTYDSGGIVRCSRCGKRKRGSVGAPLFGFFTD